MKERHIYDYLQAKGVDTDDYCEHDIKRLEEYILMHLDLLKSRNHNWGDTEIIPLESITNKRVKQDLLTFIGSEVSFMHSDMVGKLIGIAEDHYDYYYAILTKDGDIKYTTCVDTINSFRG